jgi:hypothetical protein
VINGYEYSDLSQQDLDKIRNLETEINNIRETEDQVIILAFEKEQ